MHLEVTHVPNDDVHAGCSLGRVCKHLISCGLLLFKLQPTKESLIRYVRKKKKGPQTKLSKTWCREPSKLWQIQQVGLPQKARFSNLGTCTDNFSRRTDVNQHTLTCANQPISLKCAIAKSTCHFYMQHTSDETCPCDTAGGSDICHHCPPLNMHTQKRAHTHTHFCEAAGSELGLD